MLFWIFSGLLAAGIAAAILMTMRATATGGEKGDRAIYAAQMREVEKDLARGTISAEEAEALRAEVGRRLLRADAEASDGPKAVPVSAAMIGGAVVALALVGGSFATYSVIGVPGYRDLPLAERFERAEEIRQSRPSQAEAEANAPPVSVPEDPETLTLIANLRAVLSERQDDVEGFRFLARGEASLGNYRAARQAMERVIALEGDAATDEDFATLADLMVLATGGYVSPEAEAAALQAVALNPANGSASYYIGLSAIQTGRPDLGFRIWRDLLEASAPDDPWVGPVSARIEDLADIAGVEYALSETTSTRGPTAEDIEAMADLTPEERMQAIQGMVQGLAARLMNEGGPAEDWAQLIRSLGTLGQMEDANAIADEALLVFDGDQAALDLIEAARP